MNQTYDALSWTALPPPSLSQPSRLSQSTGFALGLPASQVAQWVRNPPATQEMQEIRVWSLGWKDPPEESITTHSSILPRESHGQRSLARYNLCGHKELDMTEATKHTSTHSLLHTTNSHWLSVLHVVMCMFQCYSPKSSYSLLPHCVYKFVKSVSLFLFKNFDLGGFVFNKFWRIVNQDFYEWFH